MGELEYIQLRTDAQPRTTNPTRMMILSYLPKRAVTGIHCLNLLHQPPYETKKNTLNHAGIPIMATATSPMSLLTLSTQP